jgi:SAM-dependent methyltransferase
MSSFSRFYAECYDAIHSNKNYSEEINSMIKLAENHCDVTNETNIVDFGAGTGNHANSLQELGYSRISCYEPSSEMREVMQRKFPTLNIIDNLEKNNAKFEIVLSLFDVLSYQENQKMLGEYLRDISSLASVGGLILIDSWNSTGVELSPPEERSKEFIHRNQRLARHVRPKRIEDTNIYELDIQIKDCLSFEILYQETHKLRAFTPQEFTKIALEYGLRAIEFKSADNYEDDLKASDWRFICVLKKIDAC